MKQYLSPEQTAKLIELGFEKPKSISGYYTKPPYEYDAKTNSKIVVYDDTQYPIYAYSIGELLSFLPEQMESEEDDFVASLQITSGWELYYTTYSDIFYYVNNNELINGLFDLCVKLKEERVI